MSEEFTFEENYEVSPRGKKSFKEIRYIINGDCWECVSHTSDRAGYPIIGRNDRYQRMSRYIYSFVNGPIESGKYIMHSCDNPRCINPGHLSPGTPKENTQDMIRKGRKRVGGDIKSSKLTESQVRDIFQDERGCTVIAREYDISKKLVYNIKGGKTWKHLHLKKGDE